MAEKGKCVVVLSGGPDSSTVAYWARDQGYDVRAISCRYGQIATKEVEFATKIAAKLGILLKVIDLMSLKEIFSGVTSLVDSSIPLTSSFTEPIIVPFRNAIFLSTAVAYAIATGATTIFYGAQASDAPYYPDCRREFYEAFQTAARLGTGKDVVIEAPFSQMPKPALLKLGSQLGVPFELTWSCYLNGEKHCGQCESCVNRRKAFKEAALEDPTEYLKP